MRPLTHRPITALDTFALLTSDGDHVQADHVPTNKAGDIMAVADVLDTVHCKNHRLRVVPTPASRFRNGVTYSIPCMRLTKAECRVLMDTITDFSRSMPKTTKAHKLTDLLASSTCVYWSGPLMDDKTADRVIFASLDYFSRNTFFALLVLVTDWDLDWLLGFASVHSIQPKTDVAFYRRLCPIVGVLVAFPSVYKLMFFA